MTTYLSRVEYTSAGGTDYNVPFSYIDKSFVVVTVDGTAAACTWLTASSLRLTSAPAAGARVVIRRSTSPTSRLVNFQNNAVLNAESINRADQQCFDLTQEAVDAAQGLVQDAVDAALDAVAGPATQAVPVVTSSDSGKFLRAGQAGAYGWDPAADLASVNDLNGGWARIGNPVTAVASFGVVFTLPTGWEAFKLYGRDLAPGINAGLFCWFSFDGGSTYAIGPTDYFNTGFGNNGASFAGFSTPGGYVGLTGQVAATERAILEATIFPGLAGQRTRLMFESFGVNAGGDRQRLVGGSECLTGGRPTHILLGAVGSTLSGKLWLMGSKV